MFDKIFFFRFQENNICVCIYICVFVCVCIYIYIYAKVFTLELPKSGDALLRSHEVCYKTLNYVMIMWSDGSSTFCFDVRGDVTSFSKF